ncbi:MAG: YkgJ family cysteine cluster protein [Candidatus Helarchaeota archaeon]
MKIYKFKCVKCGNCCRNKNLIVTITHYDLLKIYYTLKLNSIDDLLDIVAFYEIDINDKELLKRLIYPEFIINNKYCILGLNKNNDGSCIYLKDNKCTIYKIRPKICRIFPFNFIEKSNNLQPQINPLAVDICEGLNKGTVVNFSLFKEIYIKINDEMKEYKKLISLWNNLVINKVIEPSPKVFLNFISGNINIKVEN